MFSDGSYIHYTSWILLAGVLLFMAFMMLIVITDFLMKSIKKYPYKGK